MTEQEENAYMNGRRAVWLKLLAEACIALGVGDPAVQQTKWISEREDTLRELAELYEEHAGVEMDRELYLADLVKELGQWLRANTVEE